jgi:SSS family solute:Na+ symporter
MAGVVAGFAIIWFVATQTQIAWPWYCLIGGAATVMVGWTVSRILDGKQANWSPYSVPGQRARFAKEGRPLKDGNWNTLPGAIDKQSLWLLVYFFATLIALALFEYLI